MSMAVPLTTSEPRHGAVRTKSRAMLKPTTQASPATSTEVRRLVRTVNAAALTISAAPLTMRVAT